MLVLTRRIGERVVIPTLGVTLEVVNVKGNSVRLGFTAPREIPIHRAEVCERNLEAVEKVVNGREYAATVSD